MRCCTITWNTCTPVRAFSQCSQQNEKINLWLLFSVSEGVNLLRLSQEEKVCKEQQ